MKAKNLFLQGTKKQKKEEDGQEGEGAIGKRTGTHLLLMTTATLCLGKIPEASGTSSNAGCNGTVIDVDEDDDGATDAEETAMLQKTDTSTSDSDKRKGRGKRIDAAEEAVA